MKIKKELVALAIKYGQSNFGNNFAHPSEPQNSSIIFNNIKYNFQKDSWKAISNNTRYFVRTRKIHPRILNKGTGILEMQSSNSSDALAMNIFCTPGIFKIKKVKQLFNIARRPSIYFGKKVQVLKHVGNKLIKDKTEIDIVLNETILIECKLTESTFKLTEPSILHDYVAFTDVFNVEKLPLNRWKTKYKNYQLIRNILAINQQEYDRFIFICDTRRPDLIAAYHETINCVKIEALKTKCELIYWQDIAKVVGKDLQDFLKEKYGII